MTRGDIYYYGRALSSGVFEICELKINTITSNYFTGVDKRDKRTYLFDNSDIDKIVFKNRQDALNYIRDKESKYNEANS